MEQIIITKPNGSTYPLASKRTATEIKSAKQSWALLADDVVSISIESPFPQTYGIGDHFTVFGRAYKLNRLPKVKKTGMHAFSYDLEFEGIQYDLIRATYDLTIDTTNNQLQDVQADTLTGNLRRFATVLISNANRVFPNTWVLGSCPETIEDKTLTFGEGDNCLSVLQTLCTEFGVEFEIIQSNGKFTINFVSKVGQTFPFTFEFGKGKGLYSLDRQNVDSSNIITRLKVYGSTSNITNKYRASRLCLPGKTKAQSYIEKPEAVAKYGVYESTKYFDDIKPTFNGSITGLVSGSVLKFIDTKMFDLNALEADGVTTKYKMVGCAPKVHFNTGNLAGYEFDVHAYDHATKTFTLVKQKDDRDDEFPSSKSPAFQFAQGNEYKLLDIALPDIPYQNDAENKLNEQGNIYYDQNSQPKVQYGLSVTKACLKTLVGNGTTVNIFVPGDYIPVKDSDIDVDKSVRIKSLTRNLLDEYEYTLTISDTVTTNITNRVISELVDIDKIITINNLKDPVRARANWRSSREVLNMVFDPEGDYYTDKIKPNSIDTLALSVGAKSMQFGLTNTVFQPNYNGNNNLIRVQGGVLTHYTIDEAKAVDWNLADNETAFNNDSQAYYIYAKCQRSGDAGSIIFSTEQISVEQDSNYYHFWIGVVNSVDFDLKARFISLSYGFTTINGRFIKTGRIESADGTTYFDLDNSEIGGNIKFIGSDGSIGSLAGLADDLNSTQGYINTTLQATLYSLQSQVDGAINYWFGDVVPTLSNYPVNQWGTDEYSNHVGDVYTDTNTGFEYRFAKEGNVFKWVNVPSSGIGQAIQTANDALDLAGGKNTIFVTSTQSVTPKAPYKVGDLWFILSTLKFKTCRAANNNAGTYSASHWVDAGYTDDTAANNALNKLSDMATDDVITPQEKVNLKSEWNQLVSDYATIASQAGTLELTYSTLTTAYNALNAYVSNLLVNMNVNSTINRTIFNNNFASYYNERTKLVALISQTQIDKTHIGGQNYIKNSGFFNDLSGWMLSTQNNDGALSLNTTNQTHGNVLRVTKTGSIGWWYFGTGMEPRSGNICLPQKKFVNGVEYTISFYVNCAVSNVTFRAAIMEGTGVNVVYQGHKFTTSSAQWQKIEFTFKANSLSSESSRLYISVDSASLTKTFSYCYFTKFVLCEGNKAPEWSTSAYELINEIQATKDTAKAITDNFSQILGGLILSTFLKLGAKNQNGQWIESAGFKAMYSAATEIAAYFGSTYEQALEGNAPLAIYHDGKLVANNATIRGLIEATSGKIANFEIKNSSLEYNHPYLGNFYIKPLDYIMGFEFGDINNSAGAHALMGELIPTGDGKKCLARVDYITSTSNAERTGLFVKVRMGSGGNANPNYNQYALYSEGNTFHSGNHCLFDEGYIGTVYNDTIEDYFGKTNQFIFTSILTSTQTVYLPTKTQVNNIMNRAVSFLLHVTIPTGVSNKIQLTSQTGGQLYNNNGGTVSYIELATGDTAVLRYYNGGWYQVSHRT